MDFLLQLEELPVNQASLFDDNEEASVSIVSASASKPTSSRAQPKVPKPPKPPKPVRLVTGPDLPGDDYVTVALGLAILREAGVAKWADLGPDLERWPKHVCLTAEQLETMRPHSRLLWLVSWRTADLPAVTLAICPLCHRFEQTSGQFWRKCRLKLGCKGEPIKVAPAKSVEIGAAPSQPEMAA